MSAEVDIKDQPEISVSAALPVIKLTDFCDSCHIAHAGVVVSLGAGLLYLCSHHWLKTRDKLSSYSVSYRRDTGDGKIVDGEKEVNRAK